MKQIIQNMRTGEMKIAEVPAPAVRGPGALVQTRCSLISAGTERGLVELAQKSLIGKARQRPDLVKQVLNKVKRDGLRAALATAMERLDRPVLQGYSSAGQVVAVSEDLGEVAARSRVACGGGGYASHAGFVYVPRNLLVSLPDAVSDEEGSFACVGAVAMQGVRIGRLELGERVVVIGLGLMGQILVQIVRANGCRVLGCDPDPERQALARRFGADEVCAPSSLDARCAAFTAGRGADAVFIMAATPSNEPLEQAVEISRLRGRIIGVGDFGMHITRKPFYERELEFRMSRSYGPGRYDAKYEEGGIDYPPAYVPWTEQRNMAGIIDLIAQRKLDVKPLITHRFRIEEADKAYALLSDREVAGKKPMGILLQFPKEEAPPLRLDLTAPPRPAAGARTDRVRVGMIGAGQYASSVLLPLLKKMEDVELVGVAAATGVSAQHAAGRFGFRFCTTDHQELLNDASIDLVMIATRHDLHPVLTAAALRAGKHVFVEKPLSIDEDGLAEVLTAQRETGRIVMVGFNRRFAPLTREALQHIGSGHGPLTISFRCNAGPLPPDHWTYDPKQGGGRIIGEGCHFIDLVCFLDGSRPVSVFAQSIGPGAGGPLAEDNCFITLRLASGSVASVAYLSVGDKSFSKERLEVFGDGRVYVIEDFRSGLTVRGGRSKTRKMTQDKGQADELRAMVNAIKAGGDSPIPLEESIATSLACIRAVESMRSGMPISLTGES
jgi:polar amino acid transport system substrate-binding protein